MKAIENAIRTRGMIGTLCHSVRLFQYFGITEKKTKSDLTTLQNLLSKYNCNATIPIIAIALNKHWKLIQEFYKSGVEFAIHGLVHDDYSTLSLNKQKDHMEKAIALFEKKGMNVFGFRGPYLSCNENMLEVLNSIGILYECSEPILWDVLNEVKMLSDNEIYNPKKSEVYMSLPYFFKNLIKIPVSLPDDQILIERLSITDPLIISEVWNLILEKTYKRGELFTLELHPCRIKIYKDALEKVLSVAKSQKPGVWIAQLKEISNWWRRKRKFELEIKEESRGEYSVDINCSDDATIILRNVKANRSTKKWYKAYDSIDVAQFRVQSHRHPFIGVSPNVEENFIAFLQGEGFYVEESRNSNKYGLHFSDIENFEEKDKLKILQEIENTNAPLIRLWRWPNKARSALSITGDLDGITIWDHIWRLIQ